MSPIGRVFIILNLLLSGAFIYFSGVYLSKATDFKQKYDLEASEHTKAKTAAAEAAAAARREVNDINRNLRGAEATLSERDSQLKERIAEIEQQKAKFDSMQQQLAKLEASYATVSSKIEVAVTESSKARQDWMEADRARTAAMRDKETSDAALAEAKMKIESLERDGAEKVAQIAALTEKTNVQETILTLAKQRLPDLLTFAQPTFTGTVQHVSKAGDLVTLAITENPGNLPLKAGASFAMWNEAGYLGEATVTEILNDGQTAFARVTKRANNASIKIGDRASTNPAGL
jgi:hypothetical protein